MGVFKDVVLNWDGEDYTIKSTECLRVIAKVEAHISLQDLASGNPSMSALCYGYEEALRAAGCKSVSADSIYEMMFATEDGGNIVGTAVTELLKLFVPPAAYQPQPQPDPKPKAKAKKK